MLDKETRENILVALAKGQGISHIARDNKVSNGIVSLYRDKYKDRIQAYKDRINDTFIDDKATKIIRELEQQIETLKAENMQLKQQLIMYQNTWFYSDTFRKNVETLKKGP